MAVNSVLDLLAKLSIHKLQAMEQSLDEQVADLRSQKELIARALADKGVVRPKAPPADSEAKPARRRKRGGRGTGSAGVLRELIQEEPDRLWMPIEIIREAHARGVTSRDQSIRVALRRMGEQGFLARGPGDTGWKLASSNGSAGESFSEAPNSGLGA